MMGGASGAGDHAASRVENPARPMPRLTESAQRDSPTANPDEGKDRMQSILGALRDPNYMRRQRDIYDGILTMSPGEFPSAVALALKLPQKDRNELLHSLVRRWTETDPHAAANFALSREPGQRDFSDTIAYAWADTDPRAAKEWALSLPAGDERSSALSSVISAIAQKDPEAALQFFLSLTPADLSRGRFGFSSDHYANIFSTWAAKDPVGAGNRVLALPPGQDRDRALTNVVETWAHANPQAALAWAAQIPDERQRRKVLTHAYGSWAANDLKAASAAMLALPAGEERNRTLALVVSGISGRFDFSGHPDPQTAAMLITQLPAGGTRDNAITNFASSWAHTDVPGALDWVEQLPDGKSKKEAQRQVINEWVQQEPRVAMDYLMKNRPPSEEGDYDITWLIQRWAEQDSQQALAWTQQLTDEKLRGEALGGVIGTLAKKEPQRAVALLAELPAERQPDAAGNLADSWVQDDPDAAAAWAVQLSENDVRIRAISSIVSHMAQEDLAKTAGWLEKLPPGASRDRAITSFVNRAEDTDPESAVAWAASISEESTRNGTIQNVARSWLRHDKAAATRWITQTPLLDAEAKQELLPKK